MTIVKSSKITIQGEKGTVNISWDRRTADTVDVGQIILKAGDLASLRKAIRIAFGEDAWLTEEDLKI